MFYVAELEDLQKRHPDAHFVVHAGYNGWSYGAPQHPVPIALETACGLLNILSKKCPEQELRNELEQESTIVGQVNYADEGDLLFRITMKNKFLAFYKIETSPMFEPINFPLP